jgi:LEA14-like dessication related protein
MRRLAAALALSAAGCAGVQELARSTFEEPKLAFRSATIQALDLDGATVALLFDLSNPNAIGVDVARAAWSVEAGGTRVAAGELPGGIAVPARGTASLSLPVRVRFRDVPGILALLGGGKDEVPYTVSGSVGVRTPFGVIDVALSHTDRLRLPRLPRFGVEGLVVRSVSFESVGLAVRVRVQNPNAFPVPGGTLDGALSVDGAQVADAAGARLEAMPPGSSAVVELPVRVSLASAGRADSALVAGGDVDVQLSGKAVVAGLPIPLDLRARVPARR